MAFEEVRVLIPAAHIQAKVAEMGRQITQDYADCDPIIVGVLKGCFVFLADIIRNLDLDITIDFVQIASYGAGRESSGECSLVKDLGIDVRGCDVLIIEDIVDTGHTLAHLTRELQQRCAASVRVCTLLNKQCRRSTEVTVDYIGFEVDDVFVVGCGLDFDERYRALPGIYALPPE